MTQTKEDAEILWGDVLGLLAERQMAPSVLAMLRSCAAREFDGQTLTIATSMGFAQRKIQQQAALIEECLEAAAFQHVDLTVTLEKPASADPIETSSTLSEEEFSSLARQIAPHAVNQGIVHITPDIRSTTQVSREFLPDIEAIKDSRLTFARFIAGEENMLAYDAAKQVANGENTNYNPLFIYGKSGLGKTHLLRAIQNYIVLNDPTRLCVYRTAAEFVEEYRVAWNDKSATARSVFSSNYQNIDVLIIDDVQNMRTAAGSIGFFFDTFNALMARGKQIVCAADRSPLQLGMGDSKFDERVTSRMDSGASVPIQVPDYELKLNLINAFYERMKQDAEKDNIPGLEGSIPDDMRKLMAERSGTNIRVIEGFVHTCLLEAGRRQRRGEVLGREDVVRLATAKWPAGQKTITVEHIQKAVEGYYDISHADLVGSKRNKELMEPRHVGIWLTRELTENTLADIGKKFGGRSHATVKHSIAWVDGSRKEDRLFHDRVETLKDSISSSE